MTIERALVGFLGAVAAAAAASRAAMAVPASIVEQPADFFQDLVGLRGETEMKRHAERLAAHMLAECKAGRANLSAMHEQLGILTGLVLAFPPKTKAMEEALDRSTGRSAMASALLLASAIVSRAQARGRPEQARIDAPWAADMIAEALGPVLAEPELLGTAERAFAAAAGVAPASRPAAPGQSEAAPFVASQPEMDLAQLRHICRENGLTVDGAEAAIEVKAGQLRELAAALADLKPDLAMAPQPEAGQALDATAEALAGGNLALARQGLTALCDELAAAEMFLAAGMIAAAFGQLEEICMAPGAAAAHYAQAMELTPENDPTRRWAYALRQAGALIAEADGLAHKGQNPNRPLADAVRVYASALGLLPSAEGADLRSITHNSLGNTLLRLGELESKAEYFAHAANSYRAALDHMDSQRTGREWALVQSNLGNALLKNGEMTRADRNYEEAAAAFGRALQVLRPETGAADWAAAEAGRGMANGRLGATRGDLGLLERTARSVDAALAQIERKQAPAHWARLQSCLGNICADLGERIGGRHWLERAITAYEAAQEEWTEGRAPLQWALSQANRGGAHLGLGMLTGSRRHLHLAEDSLAHAQAIFAKLGQTAYAAAADQSLTAVRTELAAAGSGMQGTPESFSARARL